MSSHEDESVLETEQPIKSFRRKYRKIKYTFDEEMQTSDDLFLIEDKAAATMKRLMQQNDQLAEILMELNSSEHVPDSKKFNLERFPHEFSDPDTPPSSTSSTPKPRNPRLHPYSSNSHPPSRNSRPSTSILPSFTTLESSTPHTTLPPPTLATHDRPPTPPAFDSFITDTIETSLQHPSLLPDNDAPTLLPTLEPGAFWPSSEGSAALPRQELERVAARERYERFAVQNPNSVQNWLRRNQGLLVEAEGSGGAAGVVGNGSVNGHGRGTDGEYEPKKGGGAGSGNKGKRSRE